MRNLAIFLFVFRVTFSDKTSCNFCATLYSKRYVQNQYILRSRNQCGLTLILRGGGPSNRPEFTEYSDVEVRKKELKKNRKLRKKKKELKLQEAS